MTEVTVRSVEGLAHEISARSHRVPADEPREAGGADSGPTPYELLLGALGSCAAITMQMYAQRKGWPLESVEIVLAHDRIHAKDCADCETEAGFVDRIRRRITLGGPLTDEQRARLAEIADRCPVRRTLSGEITFEQALAAGDV